MTHADDKQVGGEHYKKHGERLQHWNVVAEMGWDYFIGNATKYLWRLGEKGGPDKAIEDVSKAIHYLEKKRELMMVEKANMCKDNVQWVDPRLHLHPYATPPQGTASIKNVIREQEGRVYDPAIPSTWNLKVSDVTGPGPGPGYVNQDR